MSLATTCPNCQKGTPEVFYKIQGVPTNSCILLSSREEAINYPKGDIELGFCDCCGFIYNTTMDLKLTEYSGRYEETQGFSGIFTRFHRQLANDVIEKFGLKDKKVVEIGCGKGDFLMLLCADNQNQGIGYDPSYIPARNTEHNSDNVEFITDFYSEKYQNEEVDFVCCKMTLEHIPETHQFIATVRNSLAEGTNIFFMIPESQRILETCAFEDIYYEHCSYFTPYSLSYLFGTNNFKEIDTFTLYNDQYLAISATPCAEGQLPKTQDDLFKISSLVKCFPAKFAAERDQWKRQIEERNNAGKQIVIWGSGSKGVSFLTTLGLTDEVSYAVDINPHRQGYFMPTTGHEIVSPEFLVELKPDTIIVMNSIYIDEIREQLNSLGLNPEILGK